MVSIYGIACDALVSLVVTHAEPNAVRIVDVTLSSLGCRPLDFVPLARYFRCQLHSKPAAYEEDSRRPL